MSALSSFLGDKLLGESGKTSVDTQSLDLVPVVALYFSAHWCPPCKLFTGKLRNAYNEINADSKRLEIVWISGDEEEDEFDDYFKEMPWLAMPFESDNCDIDREEVSEKYDIASIPQLIILEKDGSIRSASGKKEIEDHGAGAFNIWNA